MAETINDLTPLPTIMEIAVGQSNAISDYSTSSCRVLTFIGKPDGSGIEVYESSSDNFNPNYDPSEPWHDKRDLIGEVPADSEYSRRIVDASGALSQLVVRSVVAAEQYS